MIDERKVYSILKETFGFDQFRFEQKNIIYSILEGRDTLAIMPTGGGKSLCYQLPAMYFSGVTLVISPLISLMKDQVANLTQFGINACFLNSTLSLAEKRRHEESIKRGEIKIIYVSPEGLMSASNSLGFLKEIDVSLIAIDEAHCVSIWGHEFRSDYMRLNELKLMFPNVPTMALTATADPQTRKDICLQLGLKNPNIYVSSFDRPNIKYMIYERKDEIKQLHHFIQESHPGDTGIVYCLSRKKVEKVTEELRELGYNAVSYHAGLSTDERNRSHEQFSSDDQLIVVATIAFGMGIDRPDVRFVAHLDLPKSVEGYYQETGRAGRDGKPSSAWMVFGYEDVVKLMQFIDNTEADENYKKIARYKLDSMLALCETIECRRQVLLRYFGESYPQRCNNCDSCLETQQLWDATIEVQKLLSAIYRTGQVFGAGYVIDVLRGSENAKIAERQHERLSVFGVGKNLTKGDWLSILRQLLNQGYVRIKSWEYRSLALCEKSRAVLSGNQKIELKKLRDEPKISKKKRDKVLKVNKQGRSDIKMGQDHEDLFESLRILRREIATENSVPPYIIFSDRTLNEMCLLRPRNKDEMMLVSGVGQHKFEKFGSRFISKISEFQAKS